MFEFLKQCFSAALAWDNTDSILLVSELTVLGALLPCLDLCPEGFPLVVKKLFAAMEHRALEDQQLLRSEGQNSWAVICLVILTVLDPSSPKSRFQHWAN